MHSHKKRQPMNDMLPKTITYERIAAENDNMYNPTYSMVLKMKCYPPAIEQ